MDLKMFYDSKHKKHKKEKYTKAHHNQIVQNQS